MYSPGPAMAGSPLGPLAVALAVWASSMCLVCSWMAASSLAICVTALCVEVWRDWIDRKSRRLNSSHLGISYAVFCLKKKNKYVQVGVSLLRSCLVDLLLPLSCLH